MLALSPPLFPSFGWPLELDPINQDHQINDCFYGDHQCTETTSESFLHFPVPSELPQQLDQLDRSTPSTTAISSDLNMVKKLNHNASERDRRKKINHLYSSLRALLPATDHTKKLSIPATVSRVLKYIPDLQQQVEGLVRKKEELLSKMSKQKGNLVHHDDDQENQVKTAAARSSLSSVSATQLNDREVAIQISTYKVNNNPISEILNTLEEDGFSMLNASSFESFEGRVFHSLHLQVERYSMECEMLGEKLMSLFEKRE
ncbi:transcription factor ORG2 isoform X1 [Ziziphus jujuba]|uniref:Transcription factor ORG2 isoform X1 n=1 Tax=Ziziphus jujuba TaxID=326968 RepID=A0A6P6FLJ8_ZIZJJ|nr:transcription factor ORG2 isoform X1 [Ziziphus jujuba]